MIMNLREGYDNASLANKRITQKFSKLIAKRLRKFSVVYCGGDTEQERKAHLVSWDICCHSKFDGGMGFKRPHHMNEVFLMKMMWNLI